MNERQEKLLEYLKKNGVGNYLSKTDICSSLPTLYPRHLEKSNEHTSAAYTTLSKDIRALNNDDECKYILISSSKGYRLAKEYKEANIYIKKLFAKAFRVLKRAWKMAAKLGNNMQLKINENGELEIIEVFANDSDN